MGEPSRKTQADHHFERRRAFAADISAQLPEDLHVTAYYLRDFADQRAYTLRVGQLDQRELEELIELVERWRGDRRGV